jgi:serine/threonine protein kinase
MIVIHRDIKAINVLLDGDMNGLCEVYDHGMDPQTLHVVGNIGYLAPELVHAGKAKPVTDVFAFGVFVLEVTCGRRPLGSFAADDQNVLLDWVQEHERRRAALDAVDPRLCGKYDADEARMAIKLGLMCAHPLPDARPGMRQVTQYLEGEVAMPEVVPTFFSYTTLALMQNDGFDSFAVSFPSTVSTDASPVSGDVSAVSGLSGGR